MRSYPLYTGDTEPTVDSVPTLDQERVRHIRVHTATMPLTLLIGVAVVEHKGVLYASWAQAPDDMPENGPEEHTRGRSSADDGETWSEPFTVAPAHDKGRNHSHGSFLSHDGELWFFAPTYVPDRNSFFGDLQTEAYLLDESRGAWTSQGIVAVDLYPMDSPTQLPNGNWIMGGLNGAARSAIALSDGGDLRSWRTIALPQVPGGCFGETTVVVGPDRALAISRPNKHVSKKALVCESHDWGENWTTERLSNYPMTPSKPNAGILSTGRMILASNLGPDRSVPVVAVGEPGLLSVSRVYRLRPDTPQQPRFSGTNHNRQWAYFYAHESDGKLYIAYHHAKEDAELSVVPIDLLT